MVIFTMGNLTFSYNATTMPDVPPLPAYTLTPVEPLLPWVSDIFISAALPVVAYWVLSMVFHIIDIYDIWPQYRLHTPAEILARNHVSRYEVARDVIIQQIVQVVVGATLGLTEPQDMRGKEDYDIAVWATRLRLAQRAVPQILGFLGLNALAISKNLSGSHPILAGMLAGGRYPSLIAQVDVASGATVPTFAAWEMLLAKAIYWYLVPALQFGLAIFLLDTWQYFLHRGMHMNKWLYTTLHSRHHRLYVPYAYGALYNHPIEGFLLDTVGASLSYKIAGMSPRQGIVFFTGSSMKTVDDHCGYAFPWDPLQHITSNNAAYHDIHHQSWGIKANFSQPFFTFWDRLLGTIWAGGDVTARYERTKKAAATKLQAEKVGL